MDSSFLTTNFHTLRRTPVALASNETGVGKTENEDFRPVNSYILEIVEYRHIYSGRLIGSRIWVFDWYQFRWPCMYDLEQP